MYCDEVVSGTVCGEEEEEGTDMLNESPSSVEEAVRAS